MNNPEKELLELLEAEWSLTGDLDKDNLDFIRSQRPSEQVLRPTIYVDHGDAVQKPIGSSLSVLEGDYLAFVTVQKKATDYTIEAVESAKDTEFDMQEEIQRILGEATLPDNWKWAYASRTTNRDDYIASPPVMAEELSVLIKYMRT